MEFCLAFKTMTTYSHDIILRETQICHANNKKTEKIAKKFILTIFDRVIN